MFYDLHVTTHAEREAIVRDCPFRWIEVSPHDVVAIDPPTPGGFTLSNHRGRSLVWEEDTGNWTDLYFRFMFDVLDAYKRGDKELYVRLWAKKTGEATAYTRADRIFHVYENMKAKGFQKEAGDWGGVCVEAAGQRLDGSYRSAIACYLGLSHIPVKEYRLTREAVSDDLLGRLLEADRRANGPDYYAIDFGKGLRNYAGTVPANCLGNVAKADVVLAALGPLRGRKILDLGCNAGYVSLRAAAAGAKTVGVDTCLIPSANLYRLASEKVLGRDLDAEFVRADVLDFIGRDARTFDVALMLNLLYHLPERLQIDTLRVLRKKAKRIVLQGNLEKGPEYYGASVADMKAFLAAAGWTVERTVDYKLKPFVIAKA